MRRRILISSGAAESSLHERGRSIAMRPCSSCENASICAAATAAVRSRSSIRDAAAVHTAPVRSRRLRAENFTPPRFS